MSAFTRPWEQCADRPVNPLWVSLEGINGVGKTRAARAMAVRMGASCARLDELTDSVSGTISNHVINAMMRRGGGDVFLRTGHPLVETLALLALKVRAREVKLDVEPFNGNFVKVALEDRGLDSVAVYQAAILAEGRSNVDAVELAQELLSIVTQWCPLPDATILMTGDVAECVSRWTDRLGVSVGAQELKLLQLIDSLYRSLATFDPKRYTVLDVSGMTPAEADEMLDQTIGKLIAGRESVDAR